MTLLAATSDSLELRHLWDEASASLASRRGGAALLTDIVRPLTTPDPWSELLRAGAIFEELANGIPIGFVICRSRVIEALYVTPKQRRQGVARAMVASLLASPSPPIDAWALPGDRAAKSLYESIGWKARLLTMRAG